MKLKKYLLDQLIPILILILTLFILFFMFLAFKVPWPLTIVTLLTIVILFLSILLYNYIKKNIFYQKLQNNLNNLDQKYLVQELLPTPTFYEGKILKQTLYEVNKSMIEKINTYKYQLEDFKDYIEMWIHEVKLPLQTLSLKYHNHESELEKSMLEHLRRIDNDVEQVLYYARSENSETDYLIKKCYLDKIIKEIALKNKDLLLMKKIELKVENLHYQVLTDEKWLSFIISQIIANSIKYKKSTNALIKINAMNQEEKIILNIYDNGIGIPDQDLKKVFQKSFTGKNGHITATSTGMGLYIADKLCHKLGHTITIDSIQNQYTQVTITFHKNSFYDVID